jgi:hypothetical protein
MASTWVQGRTYVMSYLDDQMGDFPNLFFKINVLVGGLKVQIITFLIATLVTKIQRLKYLIKMSQNGLASADAVV